MFGSFRPHWCYHDWDEMTSKWLAWNDIKMTGMKWHQSDWSEMTSKWLAWNDIKMTNLKWHQSDWSEMTSKWLTWNDIKMTGLKWQQNDWPEMTSKWLAWMTSKWLAWMTSKWLAWNDIINLLRMSVTLPQGYKYKFYEMMKKYIQNQRSIIMHLSMFCPRGGVAGISWG